MNSSLMDLLNHTKTLEPGLYGYVLVKLHQEGIRVIVPVDVKVVGCRTSSVEDRCVECHACESMNSISIIITPEWYANHRE